MTGISLNIRPTGGCIVLLPRTQSPLLKPQKTKPARIRKVDLVNRSVVLWEILLERKLGIGFLKEFMLGSVPQKNKKVSSYRLIDLENTEIGGRCISTGPSPLDLGIGAMA